MPGTGMIFRMTVKKTDPREAFVDRRSWKDADAVIELVEPGGRRTILTRAQARVPAWQVRRWLRVGQLPSANGANARVLQAFMSADAQMFYPEELAQLAKAANADPEPTTA
jgi:DNA-binding IclR family transcriptional regulator